MPCILCSNTKWNGVAMIYEAAVADAYGIAFEFVDDPDKHGLKNDLATYQAHPRYGPSGDLNPSQYTDDTLRSIANAHVVLHLDPLSPRAYVESLQAVVEQDRRKGWSKRFQAYLENNLRVSPHTFMSGIDLRAESNGAIMGAAPLGYLSDPVTVRLAAGFQAMTTHSATTIPYAQGIALAAHFFIYDLGPRDDLLDFLKEECEGTPLTIPDSTFERAGNNMRADCTFWAVCDLLSRHTSLSGILRDAVDLGGDTDSVAALAVGIASCSREYDHDLPQVLIENLEAGDVVKKHYLKLLDDSLLTLVR